jgi:hypothetical protein
VVAAEKVSLVLVVLLAVVEVREVILQTPLAR